MPSSVISAIEATTAGFRAELAANGYVTRLLVREGENAEAARYGRHLSRQHGIGDRLACLDETEALSIPKLVIVGNAGSGKTLTMKSCYCACAESFVSGSSALLPLFLDLKLDRTSDADLTRALSLVYPQVWPAVAAGQAGKCILFLDALDELIAHHTDPLGTVNEIRGQLQLLDPVVPGVVIGCRRPAWQSSYFRGFGVYHLDSLGSEEWLQKMPDASRWADLRQQCTTKGIIGLLDNPFDGFFLADQFLSGGQLPTTRLECLALRVAKALSRGAAGDGRAPRVSTSRLERLSEELACISLFTPHGTWSAQEACDLLQAGNVSDTPPRPTLDEMRALLAEPLFTASAGILSFTHQLYREYLAAKALAGLSLRKQCQLLVAPQDSRGRISYNLRNVAALLADLSAGFRQYLLGHDPLTLALAEPRSCDGGLATQLMQRILDQAIQEGPVPWWPVTAQGDELRDALPRHRPPEHAEFLRRYLGTQDEMGLIWATECARAWGGAPALNDRLSELAHDVTLGTTIRVNSVQAIVASDDGPAVAGLYDLLADHQDEVRGVVLATYRERERPTPSDYLSRLLGGVNDDSLLGLLKLEPRRFAEHLETPQLGDALRFVAEHVPELGNVLPWVLSPLLERAVETGFDRMPPRLLIELWRRELDHFYHGVSEEITAALTALPALHASVVTDCLRELGPEGDWGFASDASEALGKTASDRVFESLPLTAEGLNEQQIRFVCALLWHYFETDMSHARLQLLKTKAPAFTADWTRPRRHLPQRPRRHGRRIEQMRLRRRIRAAQDHPIHKAMNVVAAAAAAKSGPRSSLESVTVADLRSYANWLGPRWRRRLLRILREGVLAVSYHHTVTGRRTFTMTRPCFERMFWYVREEGVPLAWPKIAEVVRCYGCCSPEANRPPYPDLLEELRANEPDLYRETVVRLLEHQSASTDGLVDRLISLGDDSYLDRCRHRLLHGPMHFGHIYPLLKYWEAFRSDDFADVLWAFHQWVAPLLAQRPPGGGGETAADARFPDLPDVDTQLPLKLVVRLAKLGDCRGWGALAAELDAGRLPVADDLWVMRDEHSQWAYAPQYGHVLADWYAAVRRAAGGDRVHSHRMQAYLLEALVQVTGVAGAIEELRRLIDSQAFPEAHWLRLEILRLESTQLCAAEREWTAPDLISFINKGRFHLIKTDRDLLDAFCDAIETVQAELREGRGVDAYWEGDEPKSEPSCQNSLWPQIRRLLASYGVVGVEEDYVGANKCDFSVVSPLSNHRQLEILAELKVARKGYGRRRLIDPIRDQLWEQYLKPRQRRHGAYIVFWCKKDGYPYPGAWQSPEALLADLQVQADELRAASGAEIACYVVDVTSPWRRH